MTSLLDRLLGVLQQQTGFGLVMATRVLGEDWRVVAATANPYGVEAGDTFRWTDSICSRMVGSDRPAPWSIGDVGADVAACTAPVRAILPIESYLGAPLRTEDGRVLGTLCAIDPAAIDAGAADHELLAFAADFIAKTLDDAAGSAASERAAERRLLRTVPDAAVIVERRHWDPLLAAEIERTRLSGEPLTVAMARVAGASRPSASSVAALASRIGSGLGADDAVAVLGSNRIGVLSLCGPTLLESAMSTLEQQLSGEGVELRWVATAVAGADSAKDIESVLDVRLVGAAPASARAASALIVYSFCSSCGRKGSYAVPGDQDGLVRCRFCGALEEPATAAAG